MRAHGPTQHSVLAPRCLFVGRPSWKLLAQVGWFTRHPIVYGVWVWVLRYLLYCIVVGGLWVLVMNWDKFWKDKEKK